MPRTPSIEPGSALAQHLEAAVTELGSRRKAAAALGLTIGAVNRYFTRLGQGGADPAPERDPESIHGYPMHVGIPHARTDRESTHRDSCESTQPAAPICGARTRGSRRCQNAPMANGRCRMHGGKSLAGPAAPRLTHGRYAVPTRLRARYAAAQEDAELLVLRDELALTDARIADLLERVDSGEAGIHWRKATRLLAALWNARDSGRENAAEQQLAILLELETTISAGAADYAAWDEVNKMIAQRQRLVEAERKRRLDLQQFIPVERAVVLLGVQVPEIIRRHVRDRAALAAIAADLVRLVGPAPGGVVDIGG